MTNSTKNYSTDGGDTLVVGGRLVIEGGAEVEGLEGGGGGVTQAAFDALAARVAALESAAGGD